MAEQDSSWSWLEGLAGQVVETTGEVLKEKQKADAHPPIEQTVTRVPADASDRGAVQPNRPTMGVGNLQFEPWQIGGLVIAAMLALVLVLK